MNTTRNRPRPAKDSKLPDQPLYLRPKQIREIYGISQSSLWRLIHEQGLPSVKFNTGRLGMVLVKRTDLEAFLEAHRSARC